MSLAERTVQSCAEDLVSTNHFRVKSIAAEIGLRLSLEILSFVVGVVTEPIKEGESLTRDGY
jgi:hypothetical protein